MRKTFSFIVLNAFLAAAALLFLVPSCLCAQGTSTVDSLFQRFKAASAFDYNFPREKVFLHLDNNAYLEGETLWFKAYVVRASSLKPRPLSRVLYVELLSDAGALMQRKLLRLDSLGQANGEFDLELPVRSGYYEVRAYTREMTNWGAAACFSRVVPVFRKGKDGKLDNVPLTEMPRKTSRAFPRPNGVLDSVKTIVEFYPEGGNRAEGVAQRVAFRLTNGRGFPSPGILHIKNGKGEEITTARAGHEGFGTFFLPKSAGNGLYAVVDNDRKRYELPDAMPGLPYAMTVNKHLDGGADIIIGASEAADPRRLLGLAVFCRETPTYFDTLSIAAGETLEMALSDRAFHLGVNRIELFDATGEGVASRLVWHGTMSQEISTAVRQNEKVYAPFSPVALEFSLKDRQGKPVSTTFSLAVRDDNGELVEGEHAGVQTDLLLSSELKGYVHRPGYYFEKADEEHLANLDLLMMVQGWTANSFSTLSGRNAFQAKEPIEEKLTLNGTVFRENNKRQPLPNMKLSIKMYSKEGAALSGECVTDSVGHFAFVSNEDYVGNWIAQFTTRNENDKRRWSRIAIERWFEPEPRPLTGVELFKAPPKPWTDLKAGTEVPAVKTFVWKDTIPRFVGNKLGEAVVVRYNKYKGLTGGRYTYNGGEAFGQRHAIAQYNVLMEAEREKDDGGATGYFYEFLPKIDPKVRYGTDYPSAEAANTSVGITKEVSQDIGSLNGIEDSLPITLFYKNRKPQIFLNNDDHMNVSLVDLMTDEVQSVSILKNGSNGTSLDPMKMNGKLWAMFIYEVPDYFRFLEKRGINKRRVTGYSQPKRFFSPSYHGLDTPTDEDVRRTLYWNPNVKSDAQGKASAVFFSNSREKQYLRISVRGVTADGRFVDFEQ